MNMHKYANLPDIDTAQDVYETEDVEPSAQNQKDSSDDEGIAPTRSALRGKTSEASKEELDSSNLMAADEASRRFRKAEKRNARTRLHYVYPQSPSSSDDEDASTKQRVTLSHRLKALQAEIQSLESDIGDPSNPILAKESEEDHVAGDLIRGLADVKKKLEKLRKDKEGKGRLVSVVTGQSQQQPSITNTEDEPSEQPQSKEVEDQSQEPGERNLAEMDKRLGALERLVGSTAAPLDETSPLPPPLLPQISRLSAQLGVLTQPRHIDSISRRLKLLLAELERTNQHRRHNSQSNANAPISASHQEQILPLLNRLSSSLPQIPHILMRLRTLSALHTSASDFENTLNGLEEEQRKMRDNIAEIETALQRLEINLEDNRKVVTGNVTGLEERVGQLMEKVNATS